MRSTILAFASVVGLAASVVAASAAPAAPALAPQSSGNIIAVAGGCGSGFHPTPSGRCIPFRHGFYRHHGYGWSPSDDTAEQLNHMELGRIYNGY